MKHNTNSRCWIWKIQNKRTNTHRNSCRHTHTHTEESRREWEGESDERNKNKIVQWQNGNGNCNTTSAKENESMNAKKRKKAEGIVHVRYFSTFINWMWIALQQINNKKIFVKNRIFLCSVYLIRIKWILNDWQNKYIKMISAMNCHVWLITTRTELGIGMDLNLCSITIYRLIYREIYYSLCASGMALFSILNALLECWSSAVRNSYRNWWQCSIVLAVFLHIIFATRYARIVHFSFKAWGQ